MWGTKRSLKLYGRYPERQGRSPDAAQELFLCNERKRAWTQSKMLLNLLEATGYVMHQQFNIQQLYALPHTVFMCFVFIWEQTATCATYSINWLVFITEMKSVYSAERTGSLNKAVCASYLTF